MARALVLLLTLAAFLSAPAALADDVDGNESRHEEESSPLLAKNETWSRQFVSGDHEYHCHPHPDMTGRVSVSSAEDAPKNATVVIRGNAFEPAEVVVRPGGVVTWVNEDETPHTVTFGAPDGHGGHAHHALPAPGFLAAAAVVALAAATLGRRG